MQASETREAVRSIALVGNPNTGKTTLFNGLTGLTQRVGNYPGVTVEERSGTLRLSSGAAARVLDLPGTYSLTAHSPDEAVVSNVLFGGLEGDYTVDAILAVVDASNLERNLYLVSQVMEIGVPVIVALNMVDVARSRGIEIDVDALSLRIGVPVVPTCANRSHGLEALRACIADVLACGRPPAREALPRYPEVLSREVRSFAEAVNRSGEGNPVTVSDAEVLRAIVDENGSAERLIGSGPGRDLGRLLSEARGRISEEAPLPEAESAARYAWIERTLVDCVTVPRTHRTTLSDRADRVLLHPVAGMLAFWAAIGLVFQAIYSWAGPLMDGIDGLFGAASALARSAIPEGVIQSLVADGIIGGVGSVMIFLPQIAILFLCLAILEDCGYLPRGALLMERALSRCGLSGKSFLPLLSCFACAVPGIMSARTIGDRRDRLATILVAPLTSCSARLPVYTMFIAAFIPRKHVLGGLIGLQGLTLFGMYAVGILVAIPVALLLKRTLLKGAPAPFILELPSYKRPDVRTVLLRIYLSIKAFVARAGTVILAASVVMWALAYFPRSDETIRVYEGKRRAVVQTLDGPAREDALAKVQAEMSADLLEHSFLGRTGHLVEPLVRPLGWDWRVGMAVISSFPAREMVIASLGMIYSLGKEVDESSDSLRETLRSAVGGDGRPVFSIPIALSVMVFFALCAQCAATLSVMHRETGSWKWPAFAFGYMTILAYLAALATFQVTTALGW